MMLALAGLAAATTFAARAASDDDRAPIFHVSPAGCRGGVAPLHHGWTNGA